MKKFSRHTPINEVKQIEVIAVTSIIGAGTADDPICEIHEYYSLDGELLARKTLHDDLTIGTWEMES